ncbi:MAG: hypothetical protein H6601_12605, partial [Flavobacteriales bacterium]|nr:hypothetical protein [Flavobacteriales bacterium]
MKKVINAFGYLVVILAFLCGYGYAVKESVNGNSSGKFAQRLNEFVSFPKTVIEVFSSKEIRNIPPTFEAKLITDTFNHLAQDVYGLLSLYDRENDNWNIVLMNFRDNTTTYKWKLVKENFNQTDRQWANSEPRNPILLPNRGLITDNDETFNLYRLDSASNIVWHNKQKKFHHSMNLDHEGNI